MPATDSAALEGDRLTQLNAQILRRTWSTYFAEAEKDSKLRSYLAGHSVDVSENEYRQPPMESLKKAVKLLVLRPREKRL
jgi:hypothetical protein